MPDELIDPEEFPFTEPELCGALALVSDRVWAIRESGRHAAAMRREASDRAAYHATIAAYRPDPTRTVRLPRPEDAVPVISYGIYIWYRDDAIALLSLVSDELARRVTAHRLDRRTRGYSSRVRQAVWRTTGTVDVPVPAALEAQLAAEDDAAARAWSGIARKTKRRMLKHQRVARTVRS
jgi:hypothetical protein